MEIMKFLIVAINLTACQQLEVYQELWNDVNNFKGQSMPIIVYDQLQIKQNEIAIKVFEYKILCKIEQQQDNQNDK